MFLDLKLLLPVTVSLLLCTAGGCASNQGANSRGLTGSIDKPNGPVARADDDEEMARPVPADPYKGIQYRGGRDPVTGAAPNLEGQMPAPPAPPASVRKAGSRTRVAGSATSATASGLRIQVQSGDTLTSLAGKHQVTVAALMQANALSTPKIVAGQTLVLPAK